MTFENDFPSIKDKNIGKMLETGFEFDYKDIFIVPGKLFVESQIEKYCRDVEKIKKAINNLWNIAQMGDGKIPIDSAIYNLKNDLKLE